MPISGQAKCIYWDNPELVHGMMKECFELIDTYADDSHVRRYLLKCRECGQLYFFEFYEWIDWENGNDPQYSKYIPVTTMADVEMLKNASPFDLLLFFTIFEHRFSERCESADDLLGGHCLRAPH